MGQCLKTGCESEALDGANYCAAHGGDVVRGDMASPRMASPGTSRVPTPGMPSRHRRASADDSTVVGKLSVVVSLVVAAIVVWWLMHC